MQNRRVISRFEYKDLGLLSFIQKSREKIGLKHWASEILFYFECEAF